MDRASGSGVFARDPDALIDMLELDVPYDIRREQLTKTYRHIMNEHLKRLGILGTVNQCDIGDMEQVLAYIDRLPVEERKAIHAELEAADKREWAKTAWRIEGTLREFASFKPVNVWFDYPMHSPDVDEVLKDINPESMIPGTAAYASRKNSEGSERRKKERDESLENAYEACSINEIVTIQDIADYLDISNRSARRRIDKHDDFRIDNGKVIRTTKDE